jgi:ABC-type antimicrobial peptide transport system permease subunit
MDAYLKDFYFFAPESFEVWLYVQKGIEDLKYYFLSEDYYKAVVYKRLYGSYPTPDQLSQCYQELPSVFDLIDDYGIYANEFYSSQEGTYIRYNAYLVSDADYIAFSKQLGETHASAGNESVYYDKYAEGDKYVTYSYDGVQTDYVYMGNLCYTLVHSSDPDKTEAWIMSEFSDLTTPWEYYKAVIGPGDMFDQIMSDKQEVIVTGLISMGSLLVLMSICMYFIMRSSLMIRIKEVGIYRAIGVSKKNIVFKFFIEAIVLASLTVLVGYLAASGFVMLCLNMSSLAEFYYPLWLAGVDLVVLYAMCLFFGTIPILSLLRKTPSEILAKYDI